MITARARLVSLGLQSSVERVEAAHTALTASGRVADYDEAIYAYNELVARLMGFTHDAQRAATQQPMVHVQGKEWLRKRVEVESSVIERYSKLADLVEQLGETMQAAQSQAQRMSSVVRQGCLDLRDQVFELVSEDAGTSAAAATTA